MGQIIKKDVLVYDVETIAQKLKNGKTIQKFTSGVVYSYNKDEYFFYLHESGLKRMNKFMNGKNVISFYGSHFDSVVCLGQDRKITALPQRYKAGLVISNKQYKYIEIDIFLQALKFVHAIPSDIEVMGKMSPGGLKLDDICQATINLGKTGHGSDAPMLYKQRKFDDLLAYNFADVRLTKKLYDFICKYGFVYNQHRKNKIAMPYIF